MQRFVLEQNVLRFRSMLLEASEESDRTVLQSLLRSTQRELALYVAEKDGATPPGGAFRFPAHAPQSFAQTIQGSSNLYMLIDPRPGLRIVEVNAAYAEATLVDPARVGGQKLFQVFPDNPEDPAADGVSNLHRSLQHATRSGLTHEMPLQRYDVIGPDGNFVVKYWRCTNTPVFDEDGRLRFLLHHAEDVTREIVAIGAPNAALAVNMRPR